MSWPAFIPEKLETGNPESGVAICTLWTEKDRIKVPAGKFAIKGNLYSGNGIGYLVRNLLASPNIRYLILTGNDRNGSGDDLVNLFLRGIDGQGNIPNSRIRLDGALTKDLVDRIRENVEIIDMRGKEDEIEGKIDSLHRKAPCSAPVIIEEPADKSQSLAAADISGHVGRGRDIPETWLRVMDMVMKFGEQKSSEHGMAQREFLNMMAVIEGDADTIPAWMPFGSGDLERYYETFFGTGHGKGLSYTYGRRLFGYFIPGSGDKWEKEAKTAFDQIENCIRRLKQAPHTRRAAAFTWYVHEDSMSENPPCLTQITWNIRQGRLFQTAVFRSHDVFGGWPLNAFALRELQKRMSSRLGVAPGHLTIISNSAHIYSNNFREAERILGHHYRGGSVPFGEDRLGYFTIETGKDGITAKHHDARGGETGFMFKGRSAAEVFRKILHENLVSRMDHAAYLGLELGKAEEAFLAGKRYSQDQPGGQPEKI